MAKVVITIEDRENGFVHMEANPSGKVMAQMHSSGHEMTNAHRMALEAMFAVRELVKNAERGERKSKIWTPGAKLLEKPY